MRRKKKGYFLIELLIYTSIATIIIILCFNVLFLLTKEFGRCSKESNYDKLIIATDITLKSRIQGSFIDAVRVENNKLKIKHVYGKNFTDTDEIFLNTSNKKLQINYFVVGKGTTTNTILNGVNSFYIKEKERLIYLKINIQGYGEKIFVYEKM